MKRIVYQKDSAFTADLKHEAKILIDQDPFGKFGDGRVLLKAVCLVATTGALYISILLMDVSMSLRVLLTLAFSLSTLLLGLNVMHEAVHGNLSRSRWINRLFSFCFDLFGISSDLYWIKHTQFHHNYTNIFELDGDINEAPLIRMSTKQPWMPIHRYQAWFTPVLYSLITITWPIFDLTRLVSPKVGNRSFRRPSVFVTARILAFKALSFGLTWVLPVLKLGLQNGIVLALLFHLVLGVVLALIFQVAHVHEEGLFDSSRIDRDWHLHQIRTSADFSTRNPVIVASFGGLNFQTIHHLFPNISYRHYPALQAIVIRLCEKHGVQYTEFQGFGSAVRAHFSLLDRLGKREIG
jgi:linoleoyl-CoA desaturase